MNIYDGIGNPTAAAAAMNEGYTWPSSGDAAGKPPAQPEEASEIRLGGQAPMFVHEDAADPGLVRLGGQSPLF